MNVAICILLFAAALFAFANPLCAQWVQTNLPNMTVNAFTVDHNGVLFAGTENGVYRSSDSGTSWTTSGLASYTVSSVVVTASNLFASAAAAGVFRSTDHGTNWTAVNTGLVSSYIFTLAVSGTSLYAGTNIGVFRSTNYGTSWSLILLSGWSLTIASAIDNGGNTNLFVGVGYEKEGAGSVHVSTDEGLTWTSSTKGMWTHMVDALAIIPDGTSSYNIFAGTWWEGVFLSTDNGTNWTMVNTGLPGSAINTLVTDNSILFAGTCGDGVFLSSDNGENWNSVNSGLPNYSLIRSLYVSQTYLYAGLVNGGIWRRPISEMITTVKSDPEVFPSKFTLQQNYPNPFNPSTVISYQLPVNGDVTLKVYDVLGKEVATLIEEYKSAGSYEVEFNAGSHSGEVRNLPSGTYFYQLKSGSFIETKKMILMK